MGSGCGGITVQKQHGRPFLPQLLFQIVREHTQVDMGANLVHGSAHLSRVRRDDLWPRLLFLPRAALAERIAPAGLSPASSATSLATPLARNYRLELSNSARLSRQDTLADQPADGATVHPGLLPFHRERRPDRTRKPAAGSGHPQVASRRGRHRFENTAGLRSGQFPGREVVGRDQRIGLHDPPCCWNCRDGRRVFLATGCQVPVSRFRWTSGRRYVGDAFHRRSQHECACLHGCETCCRLQLANRRQSLVPETYSQRLNEPPSWHTTPAAPNRRSPCIHRDLYT